MPKFYQTFKFKSLVFSILFISTLITCNYFFINYPNYATSLQIIGIVISISLVITFLTELVNRNRNKSYDELTSQYKNVINDHNKSIYDLKNQNKHLELQVKFLNKSLEKYKNPNFISL